MSGDTLDRPQLATTFCADVLRLDAEAECERICAAMRSAVFERFRRKGAIVALSGGIDSSTVGALCVRALGPERVHGLSLPERDSSSGTPSMSRGVAEHLRIPIVEEDITPVLQAVGCYERRDGAIRQVMPDYGPGWKSKIVLPSVIESDRLRIYSVIAEDPDGNRHEQRLSQSAYLGILAATNFKQRVRKMLEYHWADRLHYAVAGTPNLLEYDQGFFVKLGDGSADLKPIAHLYKTQVYQIAAHLGVPEEILERPPTTDTYSLAQSQEEFYFSLPYEKMDLCLWAKNHSVTPEQAAPVLELTPEQVVRVYRDIEAKRRVTDYLAATPVLVPQASGADAYEVTP
ncbi:MAG: NAD(+) synthase [Planctomycetota bacterium]|jgi:NAD+ synthase|nr:NAD(+) synthase [Planctomycetota bacterium]